jgi:hypothetical protein
MARHILKAIAADRISSAAIGRLAEAEPADPDVGVAKISLSEEVAP